MNNYFEYIINVKNGLIELLRLIDTIDDCLYKYLSDFSETYLFQISGNFYIYF